MAAYVIVDIVVIDPVAYAEYQRLKQQRIGATHSRMFVVEGI